MIPLDHLLHGDEVKMDEVFTSLQFAELERLGLGHGTNVEDLHFRELERRGVDGISDDPAEKNAGRREREGVRQRNQRRLPQASDHAQRRDDAPILFFLGFQRPDHDWLLRRLNDRSRILTQSAGKSMPLAIAALGKRLLSVSPGMLLISRMNGSPESDRMKSTRLMTSQPSVRCALSARALNSAAVFSGKAAGNS